MPQRFVAIWFRHLTTDWLIRRQPELHGAPFVLAAPERGRMIVKASSSAALAKGIHTGMVVADCRAILPALQVMDDQPDRAAKLLRALAEWCIRFTPVAAIDLPDGLILDASGCPHLWGGERPYLKDILTRLRAFGYDVRAAMADTIGAAWAVARYGQVKPIIAPGGQEEALLPMPPIALRLDPGVVLRMEKLGMTQVRSFIHMPRRALVRRFGQSVIVRLDQALGYEREALVPVQPAQPYQERLPCLDPIRTGPGIEIALKQLLETLCLRLAKEGKGLRNCVLKCFRIDGNIQQIAIGASKPSRNVDHLFKLFSIKVPTITPALGIELFMMEATIVEDIAANQDALWTAATNHNDTAIAELLDNLAVKVGMNAIHRFLPDEHYWPERSIKMTGSLHEQPTTAWRTDLPRPIMLLPNPEPIEVTVPMPDYPPMLFRYKGKLHTITKADGPERIEQEWWLATGKQRDYYCVEDETGARYWLFRLGLYSNSDPQWFLHGFFA